MYKSYFIGYNLEYTPPPKKLQVNDMIGCRPGGQIDCLSILGGNSK